ncbi:MAG: class I SAM-dependent methyltransferase [Hyphomicrobiaceae bacterium]|nr:class I SAM-dependent methyltransferase [Hyphomicrobiaceae bacterium]
MTAQDPKSDDLTLIDALILLHAGTERQGPGDEAFSQALLDRLPALRGTGGIADLGCGTGTASLLLARHFTKPVLCVDASRAFLDALEAKADEAGLGDLVTPLCADMGSLDARTHRFALLWSEGAAYNLTFEGAMKAWRPLMVDNGLAVVSELSWFGPERPAEAEAYWSAAYPQMADEETNLAHAERNGFRRIFTERLPDAAWWQNYYGPLAERLDAHQKSSSPMMQTAIAETRGEIDLFRAHSAHYGYTFYVLEAV